MARRKFGWHTPDEYEEADIICRPLFIPLPFVPIVGGALAELTQLWNWEQVGTMTPRRATEIMALMHWQWQTGVCEDPMACCTQLRINPATGRVQYSNDGEEWFDAPDGPWPETPTGPQAAPPEARTGTATDNRCIASANAALVMQQLYWETWHALDLAVTGTVLDVALALTRAAQSLLPFNIPLDEMVEYATETWENTERFENGLFDSTVRDELRDILYCYATDTEGVVTFDFEAVRDRIAEEASASPWDGIRANLWFIGAEGLNAAGGVTAITEATCDDSGCPGAWCYEFDFTVDDHGFVAWPVAWASAARVNGEGFTTAGTSSVIIRLDFTPETNITKMEVDYWRAAPAATDHETDMYIGGQYQNNANMPAGEETYTWLGSTGTLFIGAGMETGGGAGSVYIRRMRVYGDELNPFGPDNC